ncbi:transcriptional regulator, partial [Pseudomonas aeruginosa]|nr:transcriptional regulator [Pseudomonas aeruginosa]
GSDVYNYQALRRVVARLDGDREPARRVTFPAQLIVRGSTHPRG